MARRSRAAARRPFVFLGPTLPLAAARALLPDATYLPPVAMGDVHRLVRHHRPARLAIIDGYFEQVAAVWHKEILFALERGVEVWGASSMGALRAAELHAFGMRGVGRVFAGYRSGRLVDDDEVAIAHGPAEVGYPRFSEALVNVREALRRARARGLIGARVHDRVLAAARTIFYRDRRWDAILATARAARVPARPLAALAAFVARAKPDVKAADARLLLRRLATAPPLPPRTIEPMARTWFWHRLVESSR
jgi:hypothetical protein